MADPFEFLKAAGKNSKLLVKESGLGNSRLWKLPLQALGINYNDASEMASVLEELDPGFGVERHGATNRVRQGSRSQTPSQLRKNSLRDRLRAAVPLGIDAHGIDWSRLLTVVSTEMLSAQDSRKHVQLVDLNSGGSVFFCLFAQSGPTRGHEGLAVVKFGPSRLLMQAEQFANELTRHLEIQAPECRIVRQEGATSQEWERIRRAVGKIGEDASDMVSELSNMPCLLLMEFVQGRPLLDCDEAFQEGRLIFVMEDLGRLFLLDMMLGNADRLPCVDLRWRGNPNNILFGWKGTKHADRAVAIDSCVQRRPPAAKLSHEDEAVDRIAQLALTDDAYALTLLKGSLVAGSRPAVAGLIARPHDCVKAFRCGLRTCLNKVLAIKGLLEMTHEKTVEWVIEFITDIQNSNPELHLPSVPRSPGPPPAPQAHLQLPSPTTSPRPPSFSPKPADQDRGRGGPARRARCSWSGDQANNKNVRSIPTFHSPISEDGHSSGDQGDHHTAVETKEGSKGLRPRTTGGKVHKSQPGVISPEMSLLEGYEERARRFSSPGQMVLDKQTYMQLRASAPTSNSPLPSLLPSALSPATSAPSSARKSAQHQSVSRITSADISTTPLTLDPGPSKWIPKTTQEPPGLLPPLLRRHSTGAPSYEKQQARPPSSPVLPDARIRRSTASPPSAQANYRSPRVSGSHGGIPIPKSRPPPSPDRSSCPGSVNSGQKSPSHVTYSISPSTSPSKISPSPTASSPPSDISKASSASRNPAAIGPSRKTTPQDGSGSGHTTPKKSLSAGKLQKKNSGTTYTTEKRRHTTSNHAASPATATPPPPKNRHPGLRVTIDSASPPQRNPMPPIAQEALGFYSAQNQDNLQLTLALKAVNSEAKTNDELGERLAHWKSIFRERGSELLAAMNEWQQKNHVEKVLTTGFLDGTNPIVDVYELKVRLDHMLRRLRVLEETAAACAPNFIIQGLYVGSAVAADSHHVLRHLGITHIVNATQELLPPPDSAGFSVLVAPLRDVDDEDITSYFQKVIDFIDEARDHKAGVKSDGTAGVVSADSSGTGTDSESSTPVTPPPGKGATATTPAHQNTPASSAPPSHKKSSSSAGSAQKIPAVAKPSASSAVPAPKTPQAGPHLRGAKNHKGGKPKPGGVLVHCSEGKSRSVTLVIAYLMMSMRWTLKQALELVKSQRKEAAPNAGFMNRLLQLDIDLFGAPSYTPTELAKITVKKSKPEPIKCHVCGTVVGVSSASLAVHMKYKHPELPPSKRTASNAKTCK